MSKDSGPSFIDLIDRSLEEGLLPKKVHDILISFYKSYKKSLEAHHVESRHADTIFNTFLDQVVKQLKHPFNFEPYHQAIRKPFDYTKFGLDFLRPLVDLGNSTLLGMDNLNRIAHQLSKGDNVILFANHQIEADPQAIHLLLENSHQQIAEKMIFVAGERVTTDPLAVPFSMGCNLLCIYSKRYIDHPPELKLKKQLHNKKTMELMSQLLSEGGKIIYVAPSGGRDRKNVHGVVEIAQFDAQSIEMFYLMAKKSKHPTHFYPLALSTYDLLPPPDTVQIELGETRNVARDAIHVAFGAEIDMQHYPGCDFENKHARRQARADHIWHLVNTDYKRLSH